MQLRQIGDDRRAGQVMRRDGGRYQIDGPASGLMQRVQEDGRSIEAHTPAEDRQNEGAGGHVPAEERPRGDGMGRHRREPFAMDLGPA